MTTERSQPILVHVATVPQSLFNFLEGQARYMNGQGYTVHAISSAGVLLDRFAEREGATGHAIEMPRAISPIKDLVSIFRLTRLFLTLKPQIVHAHTPKGGLLAMIAAAIACVPVRIYHIHGLPFVTATGGMRLLLKTTERVSCLLAHQVFSVSKSLARQVCEEKICQPGKVHVIHNGSINGVDAPYRFNPARYDRASVRTALSIPHDARVIGFVGRLVRDKGIVELMQSWNCLRNRYPDLHLLMVGPLEKKDAIPESIRDQIFSDSRIRLTGSVEDAAPYYSAIDILALPSYREGFSLAAIEASAMQVPVVSTLIPGCLDSIRSGETGTLIECANCDDLTEALCNYIDAPSLRIKHGAAGRRRALELFSQIDVWKAMHHEYSKLIRARVTGKSVRRATSL